MYFSSTRGQAAKCSAEEAIRQGIAPGGGLYVPSSLHQITSDDLKILMKRSYAQKAQFILTQLLPGYTADEINDCVDKAYGSGTAFHVPEIAPLIEMGDGACILELWHGPTSAFKDMALQIMPHLLSKALIKNGENFETLILTATSGDTGKAALAGYMDVPHVKILVFYPSEGVSAIQRLQMITQRGKNVRVIAVTGNFDDAQTGVKQIFGDPVFQQTLEKQQVKLSSANSINWGRLAPQIVYYFSAYCDMMATGKISSGGLVNFCVPTGNFGNILAGYYARLMGLPINRLICASNENNVLTDFLRTGVYDRRRPFHKTTSPSMDILISSNLERLLYHASGQDAARVLEWMTELDQNGYYQVDEAVKKEIQSIFWADWSGESEIAGTIRDLYRSSSYVLDPHTAVAWATNIKYREQTQDATPTIVLGTASPFKFADSVLSAITLQSLESLEKRDDPFALLAALSERTGWAVPSELSELTKESTLHKRLCSKESMRDEVAAFART